MKKLYASLAVLFAFCLLLAAVPVFATTPTTADQWDFSTNDTDTWEVLADGSLHHKVGDGTPATFGTTIDMTKSLKIEYDFSWNGDAIKAAWEGENVGVGTIRPYVITALTAEDGTRLQFRLNGPHLPDDPLGNWWLVEYGYNDGANWHNGSGAWAPFSTDVWNPHVVLERTAADTITLTVTLGETVVFSDNIYIARMASFMEQTAVTLTLEDVVLEKQDITISNLSIINDGVELLENKYADQWDISTNDTDTWEVLADGSLHHKVGDGTPATFGTTIDMTKSLKIEYDFSWDGDAIKAAWEGENVGVGTIRPYVITALTAEDGTRLQFRLNGPHLPDDPLGNWWLVEYGYNDGANWHNGSGAWAPFSADVWNPHVVLERTATDTITLTVTLGETVVFSDNIYIARMASFMEQTEVTLTLEDIVLEKQDITISNLSIINDGVELVGATTEESTTTTEETTTTTEESTTTTTVVTEDDNTSSLTGAEQWDFSADEFAAWEYLEDGSIHHYTGDSMAATFLPAIDMTKSLKIEFDFSYDEAEIKAAGGDRPWMILVLREPETDTKLQFRLNGPYFPDDPVTNWWLIENGVFYNNNWYNGSGEWTACDTDDWSPHVTLERIAGENTVDLKVEVGPVVVYEGNLYRSEMETLLTATEVYLTLEDIVLNTQDITVSNLSIVNDGVELVKAPAQETTTTAGDTVTTTAGDTTTTTAADEDSNPDTGVALPYAAIAMLVASSASLMVGLRKKK